MNANIGRYPYGFRHYESYHDYLSKYPDATMKDYNDDVNSVISFEEFLTIRQAVLLYEHQYNPLLLSRVADQFEDKKELQKTLSHNL